MIDVVPEDVFYNLCQLYRRSLDYASFASEPCDFDKITNLILSVIPKLVFLGSVWLHIYIDIVVRNIDICMFKLDDFIIFAADVLASTTRYLLTDMKTVFQYIVTVHDRAKALADRRTWL